MIETDVLIIGSGPAGGAAALALATYGVDDMVITKYRWTANTPRAHITNQRTMEILRDLGIEDEVLAQGTPHAADGRHRVLHQPGRRGARPRAHLGHAPGPPGRLHAGQPVTELRHAADLLEPILVGHAAAAGQPRSASTPSTSRYAGRDGVTATVRDRLTGAEYRHPREVPDRRRRRPQPGRRRTSGCRWRARWTSRAA